MDEYISIHVNDGIVKSNPDHPAPTVHHYEILSNPFKIGYKWVKSVSGRIPYNPVLFGEQDNKLYYCGRLNRQDYFKRNVLLPAKIYNNEAHYMGFLDETLTDYFEYLV